MFSLVDEEEFLYPVDEEEFLLSLIDEEEFLLSLVTEEEFLSLVNEEEFLIQLGALFLLSLHFCRVVVERKCLGPGPITTNSLINIKT